MRIHTRMHCLVQNFITLVYVVGMGWTVYMVPVVVDFLDKIVSIGATP
jgi:hypothetical protein